MAVSIRKNVKDEVESLLAERLTSADLGFLMDLRGWITSQGHSRLTEKQKERLAKIRTRVRGSVEDKGMKRAMMWWFLFSLHTATGSTIDFQFVDFDTEQECKDARKVLIEHARIPQGFSATICQAR